MHHFGLVSVSFRGLSPEAVIKAAAAAGLSCIEWGSDIHAPCRDTARLKKIAREQKAAGISCSSYGTYFRLGQDDPETLKDYITAARILGTDVLRLWCGNKGSAEYTLEALETLYDQCRRAAAIAEANQVTLCMECHNGTLTDTAASSLALMEAVRSEWFRMYYQPNQFRTEQENIDYAALLAPYTKHIHVFNWSGKERFPLQDGVAAWKRYLKQFSGEHTLLLEFMPDDRVESLPGEARALFQIAGD